MGNNLQTTNNQVVEKNITDKVLNQVTALSKNNSLVLPPNYSYENALKFAYLELEANHLLNTDQSSLATALLNMCVQGLSPQKKQCYFINYGGKVGMMRSYHGDRAVAKLAGIVKDIQAYVIYEGDEVNISYDVDTNYMVVDHKTDFKNWNSPIVGAYAVAIMPDGTKRYDLMTIERIKKSWNMSSNKSNNKLQNDFTTDACQRTVTRHLVKNLFNQCNDESLLINNVAENDNRYEKDEETEFDNTTIETIQEEETGTIKPNIVEEQPKQPEAPKQEPQPQKQKSQDDLFADALNEIYGN